MPTLNLTDREATVLQAIVASVNDLDSNFPEVGSINSKVSDLIGHACYFGQMSLRTQDDVRASFVGLHLAAENGEPSPDDAAGALANLFGSDPAFEALARALFS